MINKRRFQILAAGSALIAIPAATAHAAAPAGHPRLDRATVVRWVDGYLKAWKDKDDVAVGELFTRDAVYQEIPGDDDHTYVGRAAIRQYWRTITKGQSQVSTRHGEPVIQGDRATVELWITLRGNGKWMTFVETNILYFTRHAQVRRNVEYWILREGRFTPPPGWGST